MALVRCPDCEKEHSDSAVACPNCGRPVKPPPPTPVPLMKKNFGCAQAGCLGLLIFFIVAVWIGSSDTSSNTQQSRETEARFSAMNGVRASLKDPGSAKFQNVQTYLQPSGGYTICGEVNAKNSFGAYGGFERFAAARKSVFLESAVGPAQFDLIATRVCASGSPALSHPPARKKATAQR